MGNNVEKTSDLRNFIMCTNFVFDVTFTQRICDMSTLRIRDVSDVINTLRFNDIIRPLVRQQFNFTETSNLPDVKLT